MFFIISADSLSFPRLDLLLMEIVASSSDLMAKRAVLFLRERERERGLFSDIVYTKVDSDSTTPYTQKFTANE